MLTRSTMPGIRRLAGELYPICYEVERAIGGHPPESSAAFARGNAIRHARTAAVLLDHARKSGRPEMRVLNASGMSAGHQDFSLFQSLKVHAGIPVRWTAVESPRSPYLDHPEFRLRAARLGIRILRIDLDDRETGFGDEEAFDAVLFTEIAEHLPLPVLLRAFETVHRHLRDDGTFLLTTPNLVSLPNRLRILTGNGDGPYFGDGRENRDRGLFGHIALYDARRMTRLLQDSGLRVHRAETFNSYFLKSFRDAPLEWLAGKSLDLIRLLVPNGGGTLLLVAGRGPSRPVPFEV